MEGGSFVKISFRLLMIEWKKFENLGRTVYHQRLTREERRGKERRDSFNGTFIV